MFTSFYTISVKLIFAFSHGAQNISFMRALNLQKYVSVLGSAKNDSYYEIERWLYFNFSCPHWLTSS